MKKLSPLVLVLFTYFVFSSSVNAEGIQSDELVIDIAQEEITNAEQLSLQRQTIKSRSPIYEYKTEKVGTQTASKVKIGYADNQPSNGTVSNSLGGFYWSEGGRNVSVTVSVAYGSFSVGVTPGKTDTSGTYIQSPFVKQACKLMIHKDIQVTKYKQYRKVLMGNGAPWEFTGYIYTHVPTRNYLSVVKV